MRPKCLVVSVAALNLVAGLSIGFVIGRSTLFDGKGPSAQDVVHDPEFATLADTLGLEPEKAAKVRAILVSCGPRFDAVMDETRPKLRALHDQLGAELRAVITPEQVGRLEREFHRRYGEF